MVRKQNERTLLLQYRIIQLSLPTKTLFLILAPRPLSTRLGAFLSPETFSHKFFPKFFSPRPRRLFSVFLVRKIMGVKGVFRPQIGGGWVSFVASSLYSNRHILTLASLGVLHHSIRTKGHRNRAKQVKI